MFTAFELQLETTRCRLLALLRLLLQALQQCQLTAEPTLTAVKHEHHHEQGACDGARRHLADSYKRDERRYEEMRWVRGEAEAV
jgi:hypothetical protein